MMMLRPLTPVTLLCLTGWLVSGCANNTPAYVKAVQSLWASTELPSQASQLNPAYRYLHVQANDSPPALLALGYEDPHPQGLIEVWYSAKQEVIKTQNGRIISTAGLLINWQAVRTPTAPADWSSLPSAGQGYQRLRDVSPGYQSSVTDQVTVKPHAGLPDIRLPPTLPESKAQTLRWFSETRQGRSPSLPTAWFAWGQHQGQPGIVYSRQCLSPEYCLQLQRWPQEPAQP